MEKKFDLDALIEFIEAREDYVEEFEGVKRDPCPKCGSEDWKDVRYTQSGKFIRCTDCPRKIDEH